MKKKVLVVEDEPLIARDLCYILEDMGITETSIALGYDEAIESLKNHSFDLVLLDINISSAKDGIDLAHYINSEIHAPFLFITSYFNKSTVSRAKVTQPQAYLLKPFNSHDIRINVEMALYKTEQIKEQPIVYLREKTGTIQLDLTAIKYLEAQDNYTKIVCLEKDIIASQTLKSVMGKLPEKEFVRTHKSFAVRVSCISMIKGGYVYIEEEKIPIGRSYKSEFQSRISIL